MTLIIMRKKKLKHLFVDSIPATLQDGVVYVCPKHNIVSHLCACGCGHRIDTSIDPDEWKFSYDGKGICLFPSIGNWDIPCRSHYFITNDMAIPCKSKPQKTKKKRRKKVIDSQSPSVGIYKLTEKLKESMT